MPGHRGSRDGTIPCVCGGTDDESAVEKITTHRKPAAASSRRSPRNDLATILVGLVGSVLALYALSAFMKGWKVGLCSQEYMPALRSVEQDFAEGGCLREDAGPIFYIERKLHLTSPWTRTDHLYKRGSD